MLKKDRKIRGIKQSIRKQVFAKYPNCAYCGRKSENIDHVIPRSEGGSN
jgi:5-methylcytosine-specific restriction endonuclease McrA